MDHYSIFDPAFSQNQSGMPSPAQIGLTGDVSQDLPRIDGLQLRPEVQTREELAFSRMRVPREENAGSLAEMALNDLDAMLQLLAERAEYITRATGAAIALWEGEDMVCRASAGSSAPALGARLQVESGLSGESIRTLQTLRCDDAETDSRVNRQSCRALGIASVVVLPLVREQEVRGLFELFSDQAYAFAARDLEALERLGEMVDTALQHADAAWANPGVVEAQPIAEREETQTVRDQIPVSKVQNVVASTTVQNVLAQEGLESPPEKPKATPLDIQTPLPATLKPGNDSTSDILTAKAHPQAATSVPAAIPQSKPAIVPELANIGKCETCGFPISEGRKLCLDCESRLPQTLPIIRRKNAEPSTEPSLGGQVHPKKQLWIVENRYMVSAVVLFVMVLIAMLLSRSS